ncbi:hypothetical protein [Nocardia rhamnosiphila]
MPESSPDTRTLTRTDYDRLAHYGYAGPATALTVTDVVDQWQQELPGWRARHWAYLNDEGVLRLAPVNVARRTTTTAAAA